MNVLLLNHDLYHSVGGGQTVYKRLIETNPGISFYYLGVKEAVTAPRPANARMVPFKENYHVAGLSGEFEGLDFPQGAYGDFLEASNIAASVAHLVIDVVDVPDYLSIGHLLAPAFRFHGQKVPKVVLALHGNLSETQRVAWDNPAGTDFSLETREQWQYRAADSRYGISRDYLEHWQKIGGLGGHYVNPLRFLHRVTPLIPNVSGQGVSLHFIGRTEGFKGPDLFIELLAWLPAGSYRSAQIIGPEIIDRAGVPSSAYLSGIAERRSVPVKFHACMNKAEMSEVYASRSVTVLPSRMDTLNLTALESIFAGCPLVISNRAGACRFLRDTFPGVPFVAIDIDHLYSGAPEILRLISDYDQRRLLLVKALQAATPVIDGSTLGEVYESTGESDAWLRRRAQTLYELVYAFHKKHRTPSFQKVNNLGLKVCDSLRKHGENLKWPNAECEVDLWWFYRKNFYFGEAFAPDIDWKIDYCGTVVSKSRVDRARVWTELARLERVRGNELIAATYDLRTMRALGEDRLGLLPLVASGLRSLGFNKEAETAIALYGPKEQRLEHCRRLLAETLRDHKTIEDRSFEFVEDGRDSRVPRLSIIVSLYRAANKLETFLRMLAQLPWIASGEAELVFVDSHSPADEHQVFKRVNASLRIAAVYARTTERETIQKAWNRGILLARGPYLSFLGVDEMVRPDCFALLGAELDRDPALDWVQGNSVIAEVDMNGNPQRDVMLYQRIPYEQDLVYLETCYLSWVGGMYRKTIHDRFGYYDESFGAAGDTEFKNRILAFIKSKTLQQTLGVFLNYPEERTTQSPRAEIEDLRAWYLHRSEAGVEYALAQRDPSDALLLLDKAIGYRKSYLNRVSTDLEYADAIVSFAMKRLPGRALQSCAESLARARQEIQVLEWLPTLSPRAASRQRHRVESITSVAAKEVQAALGKSDKLTWLVFNDNRYEQHSGLWQGKKLVGNQFEGTRRPWSRVSLEAIDSGGCGEAIESESILENSSRQPELAQLARTVDQLVLTLRQNAKIRADACEMEMARDLNIMAQFIQDISADKKPSFPDATAAASLMCRVLAEAQPGIHFANPAFFTAKVASLCEIMVQITAPFCGPLADAFESLMANAAQFRVMEVAARLMTYKSPVEGVTKHSTELTSQVLETIQRAADTAKAGGSVPYAERLIALADAVKAELSTVPDRKPTTTNV